MKTRVAVLTLLGVLLVSGDFAFAGDAKGEFKKFAGT
jgi:hypothetical protein